MTENTQRLCLAQVDSESGYSGGEVEVFLMIEGLRARAHRCVLFCPPGSRAEQEAKRRGIETVAVRMRNDLDLPAIATLARGLRRVGADLVHVHTGRANWLGGWAARAAALPAVATRRMDRDVKRGWHTRLVYGHLTRAVAAISPSVADGLRRAGVPAERVHLIYEAVDPARIAPRRRREETRASLAAGDGDRVVLCLAAAVRRKGLDVLLDALSLLAAEGLRPKAWIAGDGPERVALEAQAQRLGLARQVHFLGERTDGADLLAACDLLAMPSHREGLGVAALEAMASGRPVVCSAVGGLRDAVVHERTGLQIPPGDARALAGAVGRLLRDDALRERLGAAGPGRIGEGFLPEQMVGAYEALYLEVLRAWRDR
jgi:glycosyltransferase involved in cell wall biosynthesis